MHYKKFLNLFLFFNAIFLANCAKNAAPAPVVYKGHSVQQSSNTQVHKSLSVPSIEKVTIVDSVKEKPVVVEESIKEIDVSNDLLSDQFAIHIVQKGDTIATIATLYRSTEPIIIHLNGLEAPYILKPGQKLRVPLEKTLKKLSLPITIPRLQQSVLVPSVKKPAVAISNAILLPEEIGKTSKISVDIKPLPKGEISLPVLKTASKKTETIPKFQKKIETEAETEIKIKIKPSKSTDIEEKLLLASEKPINESETIIDIPETELVEKLDIIPEQSDGLDNTQDIKSDTPATDLLKTKKINDIKPEFSLKPLEKNLVTEQSADKTLIISQTADKVSAAPVQLAAALPKRFIFPIKGKRLSNFGVQNDGTQNDGINIAAPKGALIQATADGTIAYCGNELKGFGNLVLINHAEGWMSAYAHIDYIKVQRGQPVKAGQAIGTVGTTGNVQEAQVHFELRHNGVAVDPNAHL